MEARESTLTIEASDVSRQKRVNVSDLPGDVTVGELVQSLLDEMKMPQVDTEGRPLSYYVRSEREGRQLHASETVGEALQPGDQVTLPPNIEAGLF